MAGVWGPLLPPLLCRPSPPLPTPPSPPRSWTRARLFLPHLTLFALGGGRWLFWPRSLASLPPLGGGEPPLFEPHVVGQYNRLHTQPFQSFLSFSRIPSLTSPTLVSPKKSKTASPFPTMLQRMYCRPSPPFSIALSEFWRPPHSFLSPWNIPDLSLQQSDSILPFDSPQTRPFEYDSGIASVTIHPRVSFQHSIGWLKRFLPTQRELDRSNVLKMGC